MTAPKAGSGTQGPVLVTGASGFLGAWILRRAVEKGEPVIACDLAGDRHRLEQLLPQGADAALVTWQHLDVTDGKAVTGAVLQHRPRAVIHLAALQIPQCAETPSLGAAVNVVGHVNVLEAARTAGCLPVVYSSSAAAKPRGPDAAPANLYGVYKKADEEIARIYWQDHGVPSLGLRPYIVYGVGRDRGETSALTAAMRAAALGESYCIPFRGRFCFQYAGDVADAFLAAADQPLEGALLGDISDRLETVEEAVAAIRACVPEARISITGNERAGPEGDFDVATVARLLSGAPLTPLSQGVRQTIDAFRRPPQRPASQPGQATGRNSRSQPDRRP